MQVVHTRLQVRAQRAHDEAVHRRVGFSVLADLLWKTLHAPDKAMHVDDFWMDLYHVVDLLHELLVRWIGMWTRTHLVRERLCLLVRRRDRTAQRTSQ